MAATRTIKIDLWNKLRERITVVQREILGRTITFQLYSGSTPINLTSSSVTFYAVKPDASTVYNACTIVTAASGICSYTFTEQTIVVAGDLRCWLVIVDGSSNELRTQEFAVEVQSSPDFTTSAESTSEYTALEVALAAVTGNAPIYDTFVPTVRFGGDSTGVTYTTQTGSYVKIGKLVTFQAYIVLSSKGAVTGNFEVGALPFANAQTPVAFACSLQKITYPASVLEITCRFNGSGRTYVNFFGQKSGDVFTVITNTHVADDSSLTISGSYESTT